MVTALHCGGPLAVIHVVEVATQALGEDVGATKSKRSVRTEREACSKNSFRLRRPIELELEVGCNIASASMGILEDVIFKGSWKLTLQHRKQPSHHLLGKPQVLQGQ